MGLFVGVGVFVCLWVCYHDNSKLRAALHVLHQTGFVGKGSDHLQLINFVPGKGVCGGAKIFGSALLQPACSVRVSLGAFSC